MSKIKVGEYARTERGVIAKIIGYDDDNNFLLDNQQIITKIESKNIKHSKNIIDLIEVDDIVKVLDIDWIRVFKLDNQEEIEDFKEEIRENNYKLLSITTKEQFKSIEYKVGE